MFRDSLAFLVAAVLPTLHVNHFCLLAFMEYLCQNNFSPANIHNYLAGLRAQFMVYILDSNLHKSMKVNRPLHPKAHTYIDIDLLTSLVSLCHAF